MVDPSLLQRKVIHVDMDAFYASIEVRDRPELKGKPVAVGGNAEGRGVIATCSYEARASGVRSAMATAIALKKCPSLVLVPPRFEVYKGVSRILRKIFEDYADRIEPLSLDEAFLDVSHVRDKTATVTALDIKSRIFAETGLTASTGVAPNKLVAKIASDINKPNGITVVIPEQVFPFMQSLPVKKIPGIGPKSNERLRHFGIELCSDVLKYTEIELRQMFGIRMGDWLYYRAQGIDRRAVQEERRRKSLGTERTFARDLVSIDDIRLKLEGIIEEIVNRLQAQALLCTSVTIKIKYSNFQLVTRSSSLPAPSDQTSLLRPQILALMSRLNLGSRPVRLIGVSLNNLVNKSETAAWHQPLLFE